jgi:serine/threonine-protein phosphatase 2A regulatory subunit B
MSLSPDGEQFLSADDLRINIWNIEDNSVVYNVLDIKPTNIDELEEVISYSEFHPTNPHLFLYTTSKGFLHICDFREKSNFQSSSSLKFEVGINKKKTIFSDLINSLSSGKFMKNVEHGVMTRDYLSVKVWDIRGTSNVPDASYYVCDYLEKNLCSLYEEDSIYDKFFMDISPDNKYVVTGNYNKSGHIIDIAGGHNVTISTNFDMKKGKVSAKTRKYNDKKKLPALEGASSIDFKKKVMIGSWSPVENMAALAFRNCIFLYHEKK